MYKNIVFLIGLLAMFIFSPAASAKSYTLSLSTWGAPKHPQIVYFVPEFIKLVEQKSDGKVKIREYCCGELVSEKNVPTAIPRGVADISLTTMGNWSGRIDAVNIFGGPLWNHAMSESKELLANGTPLFKYFDNQFRSNGVTLLAMFDIGPAIISSNKKIVKPADLRNHSVRVFSKAQGKIIEHFGGQPTNIDIGEVYTALQRGTVDAAMGGLSGAFGMKYYQVGKYMLFPNGVLGTVVNGYVMNENKFESLPDNIQKIIRSAAEEAQANAEEHMLETYKKQTQEIIDYGTIATVIEKDSKLWDSWKSKLKPLIKNEAESYPPELLELIRKD